MDEADTTFFYKNPSPENVIRLVSNFDALSDKSNAQPSIIGFLAAAFHQYPSKIDQMLPQGMSELMKGIVAVAMRLAGQDAKAQSIVDQLRASGTAVPNFELIPSSLDAVMVRRPSEFDMFWGASFATGDPRYCKRIIEHFASVANVEGNAEDMVKIAKGFGAKADTHWVVKKLGADKARHLIEQSTALWALVANAQQHEFVRAAVEDYIKAHAAQPASKALLAFAHQP